MYLQRGTPNGIFQPLGYVYLGTNGSLVTANIEIAVERTYTYWNQQYLDALNDGTITQTYYDAIIANQTEAQVSYVLDGDYSVSLSELEELADSRTDITRGGTETEAELIEIINTAGYEIIKKF